MKALTLHQPWATLVAIGAKAIETRSWFTKYRGLLAIHAAKGYPQEVRDLCFQEPFLSALKAAGLIQYGVWHISNNDLPLGALVATCELVNVVRIGSLRVWAHPTRSEPIKKRPYMAYTPIPPFEDTAEYAFGDYASGRYAWILANIKPLPEPVPARGRQGLWNWQPPPGLGLI